MRTRWRILPLLAGLAALLAVGACDDDDDTTTPGTQPLLSEISASRVMVDQGGTVDVQVTASGDGLTYLWTATGGSFSTPTAATATWTAPSAPGVYMLTITVANSQSLTSSRSLAVGVEVSLQLSAPTTTVTIADTVRITALVVGQDLVYQWLAPQGRLTQLAPNVVRWRAPEELPTQTPYVQVLVADGTGNSRTERINFTVTNYVPTDLPAYKGAAYCGQCHVATYQTWRDQHPHATAYQTLAAIGQGENGFCLRCHTVGSVGLNADPALENGGYDDLPIAALRGVQCENCHGAGGNHPGLDSALPVSLAAEDCGVCHNGVHHPTYDEWAASGHAQASGLTSPANNRSCVKCHNGTYSAAYLDNPPGFSNPASVTSVEDITCATCHDPHGNSNLADLRNAAITDVVLPDGSVIPQAGAGRLCMACHNGRRTPTNINDQINNGTQYFGPHHSCQGDMLAGTGAYEGVNPSFAWGSSTHLTIQDGCVNCHTHGHETPEAYTGHTFEPTIEACQPCHGGVTEFSEVAAFGDWDDDGTVEGVQHEIEGLLEILHEAILDASSSPENRALLEANFEANIGLATVTTVDQRKAGYNYFFVEFDGSTGVHNARYAVQLLQQSINFLSPGRVPQEKLLLE
jgi:hypothetical protein